MATSSEARIRIVRIGLNTALDHLRTGRVDVARNLIEQAVALLTREIEIETKNASAA